MNKGKLIAICSYLILVIIFVILAVGSNNKMEAYLNAIEEPTESVKSETGLVKIPEPVNFDVHYTEYDSEEDILAEVSLLQSYIDLLVHECNSGLYEDIAIDSMESNISVIQDIITRYKEDLEKIKLWDTRKTEYPEATYIWLYMKDLGWSDIVCAGIMGNLMAEVGGQTLDIQWWLGGESSGYYGMCQWSLFYCPTIYGRDLEEQCEYLKDTIQKEFEVFGFLYQSGFTFDDFLSMEDPEEAAYVFAKVYERCASEYYTVRQRNSKIAYDYFVNGV